MVEGAAHDAAPARGLAFRTSVLYCLAGGLWILFSDRLLDALVQDPKLAALLQTGKGWAFVGFTGLMLYAVLRAQLRRTRKHAELHHQAEASHRQAQRALTENESRFHQLAESEIAERLSLERQLSKLTATAPGAIISFQRMPDGTSRLPYASARLTEIVGLEPAEVAQDARVAFQRVHPDDLQSLLDAIEASARTLSPCTSVFRVHNPQKGLVWVEASAIPTREPDESILWHGFLLDITERKKAETERARLATAAEQAAEAIVITDTAGNIQYVNPAFEEVTGYTRAEVEGSNPRFLKSGEQDEAFYHGLWDTLARGQVWRGHLKNRRKDGTVFDEEATISPVHDDAGQVVNYVAVKRDVSHERQVEEQFRQAQKMEAIGRLAGGVAHDFNNLLAVISAHLELLDIRDGILTKHQESVGQIRKATERAAALTHQLLLFSRRQAVQRRTIDLNEVVTHMTKMLRRILGEDIRLRFSYASSALMVDADAGMMDQVLLNLAVNARDAMPRGGEMILETSEVDFPEGIGMQKPRVRPGPHARLTITDTGCGIAPQNLSRIFEPFFTTKEVGKGTGLGLATVFSIVEQHQGWIEVESEEGRGSTFHIYLPRLTSVSEPATGAPPPLPLRRGRETILLVEDDAALRTVTQEILQHLGYRVFSAESGRMAMAIWSQRKESIQLLLTDLVLPDGMSGLELADALTRQEPALRVIYISGYSEEIAGKDMTLRNGDRFLQKPCNARLLAGEVRNCLDGRHSALEIAEETPLRNLMRN